MESEIDKDFDIPTGVQKRAAKPSHLHSRSYNDRLQARAQGTSDGDITKRGENRRWVGDEGLGLSIARASNTQRDNEWLIEVGVGSPSQPIKMVVDTGSADSWMYSPSCCYGKSHHYFDPAASSTFSNRTLSTKGRPIRAASGVQGQWWSTSYAGGSGTDGYLGIDTMRIGNPSVNVPDSTIGLALAVNGQQRASRKMEGLLGFSPGALSPTRGGWVTPFEKMTRDGTLAYPVLTANLLKADRRTGKGGGGQYTFGDVKQPNMDGEMKWIDSTSTYYWGAHGAGLRMGDHHLNDDDHNKRFILDTGSSILYLSSRSAALGNAQIAGSYYAAESSLGTKWLVPCATGLVEYERQLPPGQRTPPFWVDLDGAQFAIPAEDLVFWPNSPIDPSETGGRENMCFSTIQEGSEQLAVIGTAFIKNHIVSFAFTDNKATNRRIGIANRSDVNLFPNLN
ncbi:acid protease [Ceraceosorus guamensis]|uniref:Acid protease n=1 Tax=Ceraceosorus guamensis TaxID=1522189 RepID=A0A316W909_9BASI|nr:acid protease [Ceraceosorus guamensis]PWN44523.1 acid protease [Ceraceosorus guamensis]